MAERTGAAPIVTIKLSNLLLTAPLIPRPCPAATLLPLRSQKSMDLAYADSASSPFLRQYSSAESLATFKESFCHRTNSARFYSLLNGLTDPLSSRPVQYTTTFLSNRLHLGERSWQNPTETPTLIFLRILSIT
jgi:hypothetical protein